MNVLFDHWSAPLGVLIPVAASIAMYERGLRQIEVVADTEASRSRKKQRSRQRWLFVGAMASLLFALASPIDYWSGQYFWVHMIQHMILLFLVPPLVLLGAPWLPMLRGLPSGARRSYLRWLYRSVSGSALRSTLRVLGHPAAASLGFVGILYGWHIPFMFNATLKYALVHDAEHVTFILSGLWLWSQLIGSRPYSPRLDYLQRTAVISVALFSNWFLVIGMAYASKPWYSGYHQVAGRAMTVLSDQQLAASIMWVLPMIPMGVATFWVLNKWLSKDADEDEQLAELMLRARLEASPSVSGPSGVGS